MSKRHYLGAEKKVLILRELLENQVSISSLAEKYQIHTNDIYRWKKQLFEGAVESFSKNNKPNNSVVDKKNKALEEKIKLKDQVISELAAENIALKKSFSGED